MLPQAPSTLTVNVDLKTLGHNSECLETTGLDYFSKAGISCALSSPAAPLECPHLLEASSGKLSSPSTHFLLSASTRSCFLA